MNKLSRIIILTSSILVFISSFIWYINPDFSWYERILINMLKYRGLSLKIFNKGYCFIFKNQYLPDEKVIEAFFTEPQYITVILYYSPILILFANILLLSSSIINYRTLSLLSSTSLLIVLIFTTLAINLFIKNEFYPIHVSTGTVLAGLPALISLLTSLGSRDK